MIATVANNLEWYKYLIKSANKKFIHLSCRDNCSGRAKLSLKDIIITIEHTAKCKYNTHLSLPSTQSQDSVILPDILISSNGIPHLESQVSPIVPDISISPNGIPHLEPQVSPIVPDTNLDSPLDIAQALLDLNSNIYGSTGNYRLQNILASRSEYFRALLYGGMKKSLPDCNEIELKDAPNQAFKTLLKYIYTRKMNLTSQK
ncbi:unnamed protein product, partial [Gordionus sp. m RMFG-2023]